MKRMDSLRRVRRPQIAIYFGTVILAGLVGVLFPQAASLELLVGQDASGLDMARPILFKDQG